jgi:hypothetical protein
MPVTAYGETPAFGLLAAGKAAKRKRKPMFSLMASAWNGGPEIDLAKELFGSVHCFELGAIKAYQDSHDGGLKDLQTSGIGHAAPWITWDFDCKEEPAKALQAAEKLVRFAMKTFGLDVSHDVFRCNLSGSKGCHVRLANPLFDLTDIDFQPDTFKRHEAFATAMAADAGLEVHDKATMIVDLGIYDVGNLVRLPNSRHPASKRHATPFTVGELLNHDYLSIIDPATTIWIDATQPRRTEKFLWPAGSLDDNFRNAFAERWAAAGETCRQAKIEFVEKKAEFKPKGGSYVSFRLPFETQQILSGDLVVSDGRRMKAFNIGCQCGERGFSLRGAWGLFREHILGWGMDEPAAVKQFTDGWKKGKSDLFVVAGDESL